MAKTYSDKLLKSKRFKKSFDKEYKNVVIHETVLEQMKSEVKDGHLFNSKEAKTIWEKSDDGIRSTMMLSEIYDNVPKEIDIPVNVLELHVYACAKKTLKKVYSWMKKKK